VPNFFNDRLSASNIHSGRDAMEVFLSARSSAVHGPPDGEVFSMRVLWRAVLRMTF